MEYNASYIVPSNDIYSAEKILKKRKTAHGIFEYLIKWKGYSKKESTWEPEYNILDPLLIDEFVARCYAKKTAVQNMKSRLRKMKHKKKENSSERSNHFRRSARVSAMAPPRKTRSVDSNSGHKRHKFNMEIGALLYKKMKVENVIKALKKDQQHRTPKRGSKDLKLIISCKNGLLNIKNNHGDDDGGKRQSDPDLSNIPKPNQNSPHPQQGPIDKKIKGKTEPDEKLDEGRENKKVKSPKSCFDEAEVKRVKPLLPLNIFESDLFVGGWNNNQALNHDSGNIKVEDQVKPNHPPSVKIQPEVGRVADEYVFPLSPPPSIRSFGGSSSDLHMLESEASQKTGPAKVETSCQSAAQSQTRDTSSPNPNTLSVCNSKCDTIMPRTFSIIHFPTTRDGPPVIVHSKSCQNQFCKGTRSQALPTKPPKVKKKTTRVPRDPKAKVENKTRKKYGVAASSLAHTQSLNPLCHTHQNTQYNNYVGGELYPNTQPLMIYSRSEYNHSGLDSNGNHVNAMPISTYLIPSFPKRFAPPLSLTSSLAQPNLLALSNKFSIKHLISPSPIHQPLACSKQDPSPCINRVRPINDYFIRPLLAQTYIPFHHVNAPSRWNARQNKVAITDVTAKSLTVTFREYDLF